MISSTELKKKDIEITSNGYNRSEVDSIISEAVNTIASYEKQSADLYHKLEVLASKIEEYRQEEDAIKSALVTAQKMAEKIKKESKEASTSLLTKSEETAKSTVAAAKTEADKIVSSAREYSTKLIDDKTAEAEKIVSDAQSKANEAINSSKIVAQDILDQAKQMSDELLSKSRAEKEAYEILTTTIKNDAKEFITKVKSLYITELEALNSAKLDTDTTPVKEADEAVDEIDAQVEDIVSNIDEKIDSDLQIDIVDDQSEDIIEGILDEIEDSQSDDEKEDDVCAEFDFEEIDSTESEDNDDELVIQYEPAVIDIDDEPADPMAAVEAFSQNEITPITSTAVIPEIDEDPQMEDGKSLFDEEPNQAFESYFNVTREDVHNDKSQVISLVPPEDDEEDQPKFRGFFKKKK